MQSPAFVSGQSRLDDQTAHHRQVSELDEVVADAEVAVVLVDLGQQQPGATLRALETFARAHDAHVVPHESPQLVPIVGNDHFFVGVRDPAFIPLGELWRCRPVADMGAEVHARRLGEYHALEQRVTGQAVSTVQACEGHFTDGVQSVHIGAALGIADDTAAHVVGGRNHGNGLAREIEAQGQAACVDGGKTRADEVFRLVRNIQVDAIDAQSLHLVIDGACDDIPGRELGAGIESLHERGAVG